MARSNRRAFLRQTALGAAASLAAPTALRARAGNDAVTIGIIGCGGMGSHHLRTWLGSRKDVRIAAVCDADADRRGNAAKAIESGGQPAPKVVKDMRELLDIKEIDAVQIATPDHWHVPAALLALAAGKHVYVEKPCSHNVREGRLLVEAAKYHKKVVQHGTQSRSTRHVREAMDVLKSGIIGEVLVSKAWNSQPRGNIGKAKPSDPPASLDYDLWVGPAAFLPHQANRLHYHWHWWYNFGTGDMGNDGVHDLDLARWGLGVETHPITIAGLGGKYVQDDDQQFPDTQYIIFEYDNGGAKRKQLIYEHRIWSPYHQEGHENGNTFYGTKGMMILGKKDRWEVILAGNKPGPKGTGSFDLPAHHANFLDAIRSGAKANADANTAHLSASLCHLGNLACRMGRTLHFDPKTERITNDKEADALVARAYRDGGHFAIPKGV